MVLVPAGPFQMGCSPDDTQCVNAEKPLHTVILDAYVFDINQVTNARYAACVEAGSCAPPQVPSSMTQMDYYGNPTYSNFPVINVDWFQAYTFCVWDGKRLPTEAEWEKAARGDSDTRIHPWGNAAPDSTLLNYNLNVGDTTAVGAYPTGASPYGVMDMSGNVYEWVRDFFQVNYYWFSPSANPLGPSNGTDIVVRGGSYLSFDAGVRASSREGVAPDLSMDFLGFRCARSQ